MKHTHYSDINDAINAFAQLINTLQSLPDNDREAMLDVLIELVDLRAALAGVGDNWVKLRDAIDQTRTQLRRILTDGALKDIDARTALVQDMTQRLRAVDKR